MDTLSVRGLGVDGPAGTLVRGVDLELGTGRVVALVGASGSGKSLTARALLGLLRAPLVGRIKDLKLDNVAVRPEALRGRVGLLFQDAVGSLDPLRTIGSQIVSAARLHRRSVDAIVSLARLGLAPDVATAFPHELSGGMARRAALAVTLAPAPGFLLADEPTTGLDPAVQLELLSTLKALGVGILFISHDLRLLPGFADEVLVMDRGAIVERAPAVASLSGAGAGLREATASLELRSIAAAKRGEIVIQVRELHVEHRRPWSWRVSEHAVQGVSLEVREGETVGLVGESGSGKTSLVRAMCGLQPRSSGTVSLLGVDPAGSGRPPPRVQLLVQDGRSALNPGLTVAETLSESARLHGGGGAARAQAAAAEFGIDHRWNARPATLSGGEARRVSLAMVGLAAPRVLIADEPTAGLDAARKAAVLAAFVPRSDRAVVLVTHDLRLARHVCTRVAFMHQGRIIEDVPVDSLSETRHPAARRQLVAAGLAPP